jgi:phosphoribosylglycinamide formyltransferase-1
MTPPAPPPPAPNAPRIGWLSTGRDPAARTLLSEVAERAARDGVPLDIACVLCNRVRGESPESDAFLDLVAQLGIPAITLSSSASWRAAQTAGVGREAWRDEFHDEALRLLEPQRLDLLVLAGYMLIASPSVCARYAMLNLHPALPGGPTGTWQEVIWELLRTGATETGAMIHLVTTELDRGPVIAFDRFPITGPAFDGLWAGFRAKLAGRGLPAIIADEGEAEPLFALIRRTGEAREIPLLYRTVAQFVLGRLSAGQGYVTLAGGQAGATAPPGKAQASGPRHAVTSPSLPIDLTAEVDAQVGRA